jgi:hypothetical protein
MQNNANSELPAPKWIPWNKGKLTGAKRTHALQHDRRDVYESPFIHPDNFDQVEKRLRICLEN